MRRLEEIQQPGLAIDLDRRHGIAYHHILTDMPFGMALRLLA